MHLRAWTVFDLALVSAVGILGNSVPSRTSSPYQLYFVLAFRNSCFGLVVRASVDVDVICCWSAPAVLLILVGCCHGFRSTGLYLAVIPMVLVSAVSIRGNSVPFLGMSPIYSCFVLGVRVSADVDVVCCCSAPAVILILVACCDGLRSTGPYLGPMVLVSAVVRLCC